MPESLDQGPAGAIPFAPPGEQSETSQPEVIEGLDTFDLTNVDTNRPLLPEGLQRMRLVGFATKAQKAKGDEPSLGKNLVVTLETVNQVTATNGRVLAPGFKHNETISLVQTDKYDPSQRLAQLQECFLGKKQPWCSKDFYGREGDVHFTISRSLEFGDQNRANFRRKQVTAPKLG
jgi:hypothetical protein